MRGEPPWTSHSHTHTLIVASDSHSTVLRVQQMASSDDELTWSEAQIADCIIKRKLRVQLTIFQQKTEQVSVELITHCDSQTAKMRKKTQTHTHTHQLFFVLAAVAQFSTNIYFKWSLWHARPGGTMSLVYWLCNAQCADSPVFWLLTGEASFPVAHTPWLHLVVASFPHSIFSSFWLLLPTRLLYLFLFCAAPFAGISSATQYTRREALRVQHKIQIY